MESNKYYTPSIEEFCFGFEYEIRDELCGDAGSKEFACQKDFVGRTLDCNGHGYKKVLLGWKPKTFQLNDDLKKDLQYEVINGILEPKLFNYRVKYLDREDIESFGFQYRSNTSLEWYKLDKHCEDGWSSYGYWNHFSLAYDYNSNRIQIVAYEYSYDESETVLFQGSCKNKSEFKTLLKQLNIE